ncbi:hypothetical protein Taro_003354 [Colocasia esculenta]|uniref:Uncharacterized protein n=1 Tax=Colocasia esculenta TaxID=4460 RepID=A0A843TLV0_COLES|nr:hypothetical protein [Colocasia esculenta]
MRKLESYPPHILPAASAAAAALAPADPGAFRYTSLRDIIRSSPRAAAASFWSTRDVHGLLFVDASAVPIRNQLVKHAASAYVQSAAFLYSRNESCLARLWARLTGGAAWANFVWRPLNSCVECVLWSVRRLMACVLGHVGGSWDGGGRPNIE